MIVVSTTVVLCLEILENRFLGFTRPEWIESQLYNWSAWHNNHKINTGNKLKAPQCEMGQVQKQLDWYKILFCCFAILVLYIKTAKS